MTDDRTGFETYVVGSLPRPRWVRELIEDRKSGAVSWDKADQLLDAAVPSAIAMQERAGVDYVSDGEWRRESYVKVFADAIGGFGYDLHTEESGIRVSSLPYPAVVEKLSAERPIAVDEARFLKAHATGRVIVAVPSPYTIGRRMWTPDHSKQAYATREAFIDACIPIVRDEVARLAAEGVDAVQLDDPWLALLVDESYREREGITNVDHEMELSVRSVNAVCEGATVPISVHLCHAHFNRKHATRGPYDLIMEALGEMDADRFAMELATPDAGGIAALARFPSDKLLGLGVIDHTDDHVETPEEVVARAQAAMEHVAPDMVTLNPDCGFSPSSQNPMDIDEAYLKLRAMSDGAARLRERY